MPEGDTVYLAAKRMDAALAGRALLVADFRVPQLATVDLVGRAVLDVASRGKHMLTRLEGGLTLHTHFRMDGTWRLQPAGTPPAGGPRWQLRVHLANADMQALGYRLPVVDLLPTARESDVVGHLGPDLLGPDWDPQEALRRLQAEPDAEIGMALLDQRILAGLGNLYRTEVCFLAGVSPWTRVADIADLPRIVERSHSLLAANAEHWEQSTTGLTGRGQDHWVFERARQPCRRCATPVQEYEQGVAPQARVTYWCPRCQPGPMPTPAQVAARSATLRSERAQVARARGRQAQSWRRYAN